MAGRRVAVTGWVALRALVGGWLIGWATIGDLSEPGGEDHIVRFEVLDEGATWLGAGGVVLLLWVAWDCRQLAHDGDRWRGTWLAAAEVAFGMVLAGAARVVTANGHGANIGGGLVLMASPLLVLVPLGVGLFGTLWAAERPDPLESP